MIDRPQPRHLDAWSYQRFLVDRLPGLVSAAGIDSIEMIATLLEQALPHGNESPNDSSHIWRPAVEPHEQNHDFADVFDWLVTGLRDACEQFVADDPTRLESVFEVLRDHSWWIFRRLELHLLRVFPIDPSMIRSSLIDESLFSELHVHHEYSRLLADHFSSLSPPDQNQILDWIKQGPKIDGARSLDPDWAPAWQRRWLTAIEADLPDDLDPELREIIAELPPPEHPGLLSVTTSWVGPTSPMTAEELSRMGAAKTLAYLTAWEAPDELHGDSVLGLARELQTAVAKNPEEWARAANEFIGTEATYISHFFRGLWEATRTDREFSWDSVLNLAAWVLDQPRTIPGRSDEEFDADPSWVPTRKAIADLIDRGLERIPAEIPANHGDTIWHLLRTLTDDEEPTPTYEATYGGENMDPPTLALNTVRPMALRATINYALWLRRQREGPDSSQWSERGFLNQIPEVREVLSAHLDPSIDPSLAARSVYGQRLPWLALIDEQWVRTQTDSIFPLGPDYRELWEAAWGTYVVFCRPYDSVLDLLMTEYLEAVDRAGAWSVAWRSGTSPDHRLAEHIVSYYFRGRLELDDPLLVALFSQAPVDTRSHAMRFAGRILWTWPDDEPIAEERVNRLIVLWRARVGALTEQGGPFDELVEFGWWFASRRLPDTEALTLLHESLAIAGWVEPDHEVVETLAEIVESDPLTSVRCLAMMADGAKEPWSVSGWRDSGRRVVATAIKAGGQAKIHAVELANRLVARGNRTYEELLVTDSD